MGSSSLNPFCIFPILKELARAVGLETRTGKGVIKKSL
jgi:hypothetical protein